MTAAKSILILNGALGGAEGNTARALAHLEKALGEASGGAVRVETAHLSESAADLKALLPPLLPKLREASALVFATGTYWDSWGSPMQRFFEEATDHEGTDLWLGKPAAVFVTMHSMGGKEVASRLQGVLNSIGLWVPPMCAMTYSLANHLALQAPESGFQDDLWRLEDLVVLARNLIEATRGGREWSIWPVDRADPYRVWLDR